MTVATSSRGVARGSRRGGLLLSNRQDDATTSANGRRSRQEGQGNGVSFSGAVETP